MRGRVLTVALQVGVCSPGHALLGGHCVPIRCTRGCEVGGDCREDLLTLPHSPMACEGRFGDGCIYFCDSGYHVDGVHWCLYDGSFDGGNCAINVCESMPIENSTTVCTGVFMDVCAVACNFGYTQTAPVSCQPERIFAGGTCEPNLCTQHSTLADSPTDCTGGRTTDVCPYTCNPGWTRQGEHVCMASGAHEGGHCQINTCTAGLAIGNSPTVRPQCWLCLNGLVCRGSNINQW
jgi:hypothetical protein